LRQLFIKNEGSRLYRILLMRWMLLPGILLGSHTLDSHHANAHHANAMDYHDFFQSHCVKCHGSEKQEGDLRLDKIAPLSSDQNSLAVWASIAEQLDTGEMPPESEPPIAKLEKRTLVQWISSELAKAATPIPALRRLNRTEYQYTIRDLLGIDVSLADVLPEDGSVQGVLTTSLVGWGFHRS